MMKIYPVQILSLKRASLASVCVLVLSALMVSNAQAEPCQTPGYPSTYVSPADKVTVCDAYDDGPRPGDVPAYKSRNTPTGKAIVFGTKYKMQDRFNFFNHEVGDLVNACNHGTPTITKPCPKPTWLASFANVPATTATQTLVAIWSDTPEGWASTHVYIPNGDSAIGSEFTVTPADGTFHAGPDGIAGKNIPVGMGGYFYLNVPVGAKTSTAFTYRSSLHNKITYQIFANIVTSSGSMFRTDSSSTNFKPAIEITSAPVSVTAGACSGMLTVSVEDGDGNPRDTLAVNPLNLPLKASPAFTYLDSACVYPTSTVGIANPVPAPSAGPRPPMITSKQLANFYIKTSSAFTALPVSIDYVDTDGKTIFTTSQNQKVTASAPVAIRMSAPGAIAAGACSSAIRVYFTDKFNNEAPLSSAKTLTLGGTNFYSTSDCSGSAINTVAGSVGMSSTNLYIKDGNAGTDKLLVNAPGLQGADATVRILANLVFAKATDRPHANNMAYRLYRRLTGKPPLDSDPRLAQMSDLFLAGKALDAADIAAHDPGFLNNTVRMLFTVMSNRLEDPTRGLNDFTATGVGLVRDDRDARELLTGNYIYVGKKVQPPNMSTCATSLVYKNNSHFDGLDAARADLSTELVLAPQCTYNTDNPLSDTPIPTSADEGGGLSTSSQWGREHVVAGTNRRAFEYVLKEFNCLTMTELSDTSVADWHIRRDVDRAPGANPQTYQGNCRGCHGLMDQASGAFAFHDWYTVSKNGMPEDSRLFHMRGGYGGDAVMPKMNQNGTTAPYGWISSDDSWLLNLSDKQTQLLGIDEGMATSGNGVHSLNTALANSASFRSCMAKKAFKTACLTAPTPDDASTINDLANYFQQNYNLRSLIERAAVLGRCLGQGDSP